MTAGLAGGTDRDIALPPGWVLHRHGSVTSTNDIAKDLAQQGAAHGTVVLAEQQEAGRGRQGRAWSSPPGNLYVSVLLRPTVLPALVAQLSLVAALAMAEALAGFVPGGAVRVKWPNDVLVDDAKISGLLLESAGADRERVEWVVIGSGVNIVSHPSLAERPTVALVDLGARDATPASVLEGYLARLNILVDRWASDGFDAIRPHWLDWAAGVGSPVRVGHGEQSIAGRFLDLDGNGALILGLPDGGRRTIAAGDLVLAGG